MTSKVWRGWVDFLFALQSDRWLAKLRIAFGLLIIAYALSVRTDWFAFVGDDGDGFVDRSLSEIWSASTSQLIPRVTWLVQVGKSLHCPESTTLRLTWSVLVASGLFLAAGLFCRSAAFAAWFLHLAAAKSGGLLAYGVDNFLTIGLFILVLAPWPDRWSLDHRWRGLPSTRSCYVGFFKRILQITLCFTYFFGGLTKCIGPDWWNGEALWRALTHPPFGTLPVDWIFRCHFLLPPAGIVTWLLEMACPVMVTTRFRRLWLVSICFMHFAIGLAMGMWLFSATMIALNLAAFGRDPACRGGATAVRLLPHVSAAAASI
jgi:hypothetical protein